jgi:CRISPR-associated protein Cmr6
MSDSNLVPLMYQSQIKERGKIQYVGTKTQTNTASKWLEEWLEGCPPIPQPPDESVPLWKRKKPQSEIKIPQFGPDVHTWEYTQNWRFVTNSGQDEGIIRPVIGAKGIPHYPGSSMKGAFLRACQQIASDKVQDYCGGEVEEIIDGKKYKRTKPGILRFHGGYPIDMSWANRERLLDIVHSQQERQVERDSGSSANVQISLYKTIFRFGISAIKNSTHVNIDWDLVEKIWEQALSQGIGSRTSAGYGYFSKSKDAATQNLSIAPVISVKLDGQGISSTLLNGSKEFRPNMFKAALRGHTLRLLAGVTNEEKTRELTNKLWGGFIQNQTEQGSIVGRFSVNFEREQLEFIKKHKYKLNSGKINIFEQYRQGQKDEKEREFLILLVKFSLLLGGFGRSWRRVDHNLFYPSYFHNTNKPMFGCHWSFSNPNESAEYCITAPGDELTNIKDFLSGISDKVRDCFNLPSTDTYTESWREVWHPDKVQVWGRVANSKDDSMALPWFHKDNFIKRTKLTGYVGNARNPSKVGRIWHRMYPLYEIQKDKITHKNRGREQYIELLTIFRPRNSEEGLELFNRLLNRLENDSSFQKVWGN